MRMLNLSMFYFQFGQPTYDYKGKSYQYIINGETGQIHGTYPYSWIKITLLIILGVIAIYFIFVYFNN